MAHLIKWDNKQKTVLLQQYHEGASKDDLYELAHKNSEMLTTVSHTVHLIIDERKIHLMLTRDDMLFLENLLPENQGRVVIVPPVGSITYKKMLQKVAESKAPRAFHEPFFAYNLDDARDILQDVVGVMYP
ncbi:MAG: hypothetical protein AAFV93_22130 [Chloroflexota bacterium]